MKQKSKHNGIISFWKFMFSMVILLFHCGYSVELNLFLRGNLAVEFFFIVSGYLMALHVFCKRKEDNLNLSESTWQYLGKKFKVLFPYVLVAFIITIFVNSYLYGVKSILHVNSIWNLFLLDMAGFVTDYILIQTWYISAMLIAMLILYPLLKKYQKNFVYLIAPIIVLLVGGYISNQYGVLCGSVVWSGIIMYGLLRAIMEISLGSIIYIVVEKIKKVDFTILGRFLFTIFEIGGFILVFLIISKSSKKYDFIVLLLLAESIMFAFSEKTLFYQLSNNRVCYFLEKVSLPIYLNHIWIRDLFVKIFPDCKGVIGILMIIVLTIGFSSLNCFVFEKLNRSFKNKLKKLFIKEVN